MRDRDAAETVLRGRVLAVDGDGLRLRTERADLDVACSADRRAPVRAGDLVEIHPDASGQGASEPGAEVSVRVLRAYRGGPFPGPASETARLGRTRLTHLRARARAMAALRGFFAERDFLEVETPLLVGSPGLEVHLDPVPAGRGQWLITSPEFQMKRLLAAGLERVYTVCKCFRADELGAQHNVEFTMIEWYRAWAGWEDILGDTEALVAAVAEAVAGAPRCVLGERVIDLSPPWPRLTVAEAMARFAGVAVSGAESAAELAQRARAAGVDIGSAEAWDDIFYTVFVDRVEPALAALERPVALVDWPAPLAALARRKPGAPHLVERFEVYVAGIELCNAFGELVDAAEQRARFAASAAERARRGRAHLATDEALLRALDEGLPACAGIALGIDRLLMLVTGASHIREVLTFASDEL